MVRQQGEWIKKQVYILTRYYSTLPFQRHCSVVWQRLIHKEQLAIIGVTTEL